MAMAIVAPWWFLGGVIGRGQWSAAEVQTLLMLGHTERVGPIAAALAALKRAKVSTDAQLTRCEDSQGNLLEQPLEAPKGVTRRFLLRAYRYSQVSAVASRRPDFAYIGGGVDHWASNRTLVS